MSPKIEKSENQKKEPTKKTRNRKSSKPIPYYQQLLWETEEFLNDLECAKEMFETITPVLKEKDEKRKKKIDESLESFKTLSKKDNINKEISITKIRNLMTAIKQLSRANQMFRTNSNVLLVSRYDEFISNVLKIYYKAFPNKLKNPDKTISYDEIVELNSVESIKDAFIDKEIDRLLRGSHVDQIDFIDNNLKLGIKEHCTKIKDFIEITERRNIIVHNGGRVNKQYLHVCKKNDIKINAKIKDGSILSVTDEYFEQAFACVFELGLRIGQSSVRRLFPESLEYADTSLINSIGFPILESENWELSKIIFEFAKNIPIKFVSDDRSHRIYVINLCICLKHLKKKKDMFELINSYDWSSSGSEFQLAVNILQENYDEAENIMKNFSEEEPFPDHAYQTWPLFLEFRRTENFHRAYKNIYKNDFEPDITKEKVLSFSISENN